MKKIKEENLIQVKNLISFSYQVQWLKNHHSSRSKFISKYLHDQQETNNKVVEIILMEQKNNQLNNQNKVQL